MSVAIDEAVTVCFHCGLDAPVNPALEVDLLGARRAMCCVGCLAVAETLKAQGLEDWYATREGPSGVPATPVPEVLARAGLVSVASTAAAEVEPPLDLEVRTVASDLVEASLLVEGIRCAACVWVIERHLGALDGVREVRVSATSHRVRVRWTVGRCDATRIVTALAAIGFAARPDRPDESERLARRERRTALMRLGVAGLATMNVMTFAVALYAGEIEGMSGPTRRLLRLACWLVATPVVFVSARPFFEGAWRDLRVRSPGMDVPVALAIGATYGASAWAVVADAGDVYFESACMFTLFLGTARFVELSVRQAASARARGLLAAAPDVARRLEDGAERWVSSRRLAVGDRVRVCPGEALPVDGRVRTGSARVEEAMLTGEPWPRSVAPGDPVRAGSVVIGAPLEVDVTASAGRSTLAMLNELIDRAASEKPALARRADRLASVFVMGVLLVATATAVFWSLHDPGRAFEATVAVLVATCPCALGLATPAALAATHEGLARIGFVAVRSDVLERLATIDRVVFDKTGTLTEGRPRLVHVVPTRAGISEADALARARRLEAGSSHPLARAFGYRTDAPVAVAAEAREVTGQGVEAKLDARLHRLGRRDWVAALAEGAPPSSPPSAAARSWVLLGDEAGAIAWFGLDDRLRDEAEPALAALRADGVALELSSGDPSPAAAAVAEALGLERAPGAPDPAEKLARIRSRVAAGERVAFVGDGLNDAPVMQAATLSIAMGGGCDRTRLGADAVLWHDDLGALPRARAQARRARRVIRQNFGWAIAYNLCALPLAMSGRLAPWWAALGMSLSSLVVVANSARLRRVGQARCRS